VPQVFAAEQSAVIAHLPGMDDKGVPAFFEASSAGEGGGVLFLRGEGRFVAVCLGFWVLNKKNANKNRVGGNMGGGSGMTSLMRAWWPLELAVQCKPALLCVLRMLCPALCCARRDTAQPGGADGGG
jgi:hypothetical protein